jgi:hypothetical protein
MALWISPARQCKPATALGQCVHGVDSEWSGVCAWFCVSWSVLPFSDLYPRDESVGCGACPGHLHWDAIDAGRVPGGAFAKKPDCRGIWGSNGYSRELLVCFNLCGFHRENLPRRTVISIRTQKKIKQEVDETQKRLSSLEGSVAHVNGGGGSVMTTAQRTSSEETKEKNSNDEDFFVHI